MHFNGAMQRNFKWEEYLTNPWLMGVVSVILSVSVYGLILLFVDLQEPMMGLYMSTIIPALVAPPIAILIRRSVRQVKAKNRELAELNATNKKLFSLLSHDLRSPIASLKSVMDLLIEQRLSEEEAREMFKDLSHKTERVLDFLNDILTWSLKQSELKPMQADYFQVKDSIESILDLFEDQRRAKHINLDTQNLNEAVFADKDSFAFVFRNVYHNALKFTPEGGEIQVYTEVKDGKLHTVVADSGVGMNNETIETVLNPEKWFSTKGTHDESGTGFGISSSLNYLRDNHGELRIESEPGKGSRFIIVLPQLAEMA